MNDLNRTLGNGNPAADDSNEASVEKCQALAGVIVDVEEFARGWVGRIRQLIHRSSRLVERESLLAGAIARMDQEKAEWSKRTAAKEEALREQSKKLTEAWLDVESERRKAIQGARAANVSGSSSAGNPAIGLPLGAGGQAATVRGGQAATVHGGQAATVQQAVVVPVQPTPTAPGTPMVNPVIANSPPVAAAPNIAPISSVPSPSPMAANTPPQSTAPKEDSHEQAEAETRQRIEEFKRMQRAIRSNRNR